MVKFTEVQKYNRPMHWVVFGFIFLLCAIPTLAVNLREKEPLIGNIISICAASIFVLFWFSVRLETSIDETGLHYRYRPFHRKKRFVPWTEIAQIGVEQYNSFKDYGGWGLRQKPLDSSDILLNVSGSEGIRIYSIDGRKLLIGTLKGEEAKGILAALIPEVLSTKSEQ